MLNSIFVQPGAEALIDFVIGRGRLRAIEDKHLAQLGQATLALQAVAPAWDSLAADLQLAASAHSTKVLALQAGMEGLAVQPARLAMAELRRLQQPLPAPAHAAGARVALRKLRYLADLATAAHRAGQALRGNSDTGVKDT